MNNNGWLKVIISILASLALGAYGFSYTGDRGVEDRVMQRIDRLEDRILSELRRHNSD